MLEGGVYGVRASLLLFLPQSHVACCGGMQGQEVLKLLKDGRRSGGSSQI